MRSFVVVGRSARADASVRLDDLASTSGRLDVLARCVRAAFCVSHGIRRDVRAYLVMLGGAGPRAVRIDGAEAKFIRPDERSLATTLLKAVARVEGEAPGFVAQRLGVAVACGGLEAVLADVGGAPLFVLEEGAADVRGADVTGGVFVIGDPGGFDEDTRAQLEARGARPLAVGPVGLHSEDVIAILQNELDRRAMP